MIDIKKMANMELVNALMLYRLAYEENQSADMWKKVQEVADEIVLRMSKQQIIK